MNSPQTFRRRFSTLPDAKSAVQFLLKTPKHGRATFSIVKRVVNRQSGAKTHETLKLSQIDSINQSFKNKVSYETCLQHAKAVVVSLYEDADRLLPVVMHGGENRKIFERYWKAECEDKDISAPKASENRLIRAISTLGEISLQSSTKEALQKQVNSVVSGNKQRDTVAALNQLMRFIGRKDRLRKGREEVRSPRYLTKKEFESVLAVLPDDQRLVFKTAFATGCRLGEVFSLERRMLAGDQITVENQMDEKGLLRATKNRLIRKTLILKPYYSAVLEWLDVPLEARFKIRNLAWSKIAKEACRKAKIAKACVFHDLRHSFAIHLKENGASITEIAQTLGNSVIVAEKYYAGRAGTEESISQLSQKINSRPS